MVVLRISRGSAGPDEDLMTVLAQFRKEFSGTRWGFGDSKQLWGQFATIMTIPRLLGELCRLSKLSQNLNGVYKCYVTRILRGRETRSVSRRTRLVSAQVRLKGCRACRCRHLSVRRNKVSGKFPAICRIEFQRCDVIVRRTTLLRVIFSIRSWTWLSNCVSRE